MSEWMSRGVEMVMARVYSKYHDAAQGGVRVARALHAFLIAIIILILLVLYLLNSSSSSSSMPAPLLGDVFPDFEADTTIGKIRLHDYLGDSWGILFSHPRDYTPVCTTELGRAAVLSPQFAKRNVKMIALSIDSVEDHHGWTKDILAYNNDETVSRFPFPIIADAKRELAVQLGMLDPDEKDQTGMPLTARCVFVIGPDKKLKLSVLYPATTGRNFDEILRVIDSLQLTANHRVATPVDWKPGDRVMVPASIPEEEAKTLFPAGVYTKELPSGKKYLRYTPQPCSVEHDEPQTSPNHPTELQRI